MKILNKFIWSKKEPSNKNDIWFDGSTWRMYTEEAWQSFTLPVDAADKVAKVLENASEVYQEKLNAGYGIVIEGNTISLDMSSIDIDTTHNIGSIELFNQLIFDRSHYSLNEEDINAISEGKLITTTNKFNTKIPITTINHMTQADEVVGYYLVFYTDQILYRMYIDTSPCSIIGGLSIKENLSNKWLSTNDYTNEDKEKLYEVEQTTEELEQQLTELSEANEVLKEAQQFTDVAIKDLQDMKIDREADDYYPKIAVGLADNLAGVDVVDSEINFRRSGGGAISDGVARIETIKGNSVVWNQIFTGGFAGNKASVENVDNGAVITAEAATFINAYIPFAFIPNHKYLYSTIATLAYADTVVIGTDTNGNAQYRQMVGANTPTAIEGIVSCVSPAATFYIFPNWNVAASVGDSFRFEDIRIVDLTKMFGAGNEPTTIEEFYQRIPMGVDLNAYNEGEVIHMDVQSIESMGVNQWDGVLESGRINSGNGQANTAAIGQAYSPNYIPILPNTAYYAFTDYIEGTTYVVYFYAYFYDKNLAYIGQNGVDGIRNAKFTPPTNAAYMRLHLYSAHPNGIPAGYQGVCVNLFDTSINGKYYPYIKRVEDLAVIRKYFPDGIKSAGTAHDEIRYNKASGKWEKVEAIGIRAYQEGDADNASYLTDGKVTCYPLAEPIVTELDEADQFKDLDYQVWNCGTEKAIAEGKSAPLAADITYGFNAIGKIKELESLVAALVAKVGI